MRYRDSDESQYMYRIIIYSSQALIDRFILRNLQRIASEVCLIDQNVDKASAEAEDIQHAGIFLGCPLVIGTSGIFDAENICLDIIYITINKTYNDYTIHLCNCTFPLLAS